MATEGNSGSDAGGEQPSTSARATILAAICAVAATVAIGFFVLPFGGIQLIILSVLAGLLVLLIFSQTKVPRKLLARSRDRSFDDAIGFLNDQQFTDDLQALADKAADIFGPYGNGQGSLTVALNSVKDARPSKPGDEDHAFPGRIQGLIAARDCAAPVFELALKEVKVLCEGDARSSTVAFETALNLTRLEVIAQASIAATFATYLQSSIRTGFSIPQGIEEWTTFHTAATRVLTDIDQLSERAKKRLRGGGRTIKIDRSLPTIPPVLPPWSRS